MRLRRNQIVAVEFLDHVEGGCIDAQRIKELERGLRDFEQRVYRLEKAVMDSVVTEPECK